MAVTPQNETRARLYIREVEESNLDSESKSDLTEMIEGSKIATNGLSQEEKLQSVADNQFRMICALSRSIVAAAKPVARTWKDVIVECRAWLFPSVCVSLGIVAAAFILKPELAQIAAQVAEAR